MGFEEAAIYSAAGETIAPTSGSNPAGPDALFKLDEPTGTTAANALYDEEEADGTYVNGVTLGERARYTNRRRRTSTAATSTWT